MYSYPKQAILAIGGAFNPVHTQHVKVLEIAKETVEKRRPDIQIIGGYFAVSTNGYVKSKLKDKAMKGVHRLEMCRLAMEGFDWMIPTTECFGSAPVCAKKHSKPNTLHIIVVGADRAITQGGKKAKWRANPKKGTMFVCVGRPGDTENVKKVYETDIKKGLDIEEDYFMFADCEAEDVSSTKVRVVLEEVHNQQDQAEKQRIIKEKLVDTNILSQKVATYILDHEDDLYL
eukprot:TRINITY_DN1675_c0_g1_i1.p1 TRINITY_DN1675_c0_g1~~TRINITY_DN1675_c0_g1_i1.p1  ORF type:complete len:231 (-),score=35.79 TRINITY_DN1675_c0_g1_i1:4-696(-)